MGKYLWILVILLVSLFLYLEDKEDKPVPEPEEVNLVSEPEIAEPEVASPRAVLKKAPLKRPKKAKVKKVRVKYPNLDDSYAAFDPQGNLIVTQVVKVGKHLVYHGDVLIGDEDDLEDLKKKKIIRRGPAQKWPNGKIPYVIDESVAQPEVVTEAIEYLNQYTNLNIVPRGGEENYVRVTKGEANCYAYAGMIGGEQPIYLVPQCGLREILHEWMHTIGFLHEQNRQDRDRYIKVLWDNIDEMHWPQFKKLPDQFMGVLGRPFDFQSIMLYSSLTFGRSPDEPSLLTTDGDLLPPSKSLLSDEDIQRINTAYP